MVVLIESANVCHNYTIRQKDVSLYMDDRLYGKGLLNINEKYITNLHLNSIRNIIWTNENNRGIKLEYLSLSAHGICRDRSKVPEDCIFLFYDKKLNGIEPLNTESSDIFTSASTSDLPNDKGDDDEEESTNIYLIPNDKGTLDALYVAIKECQKLNPDLEEQDISENEDDEFWEPDDALDGHTIEQEIPFTAPTSDAFDTPQFDENGQLIYNHHPTNLVEPDNNENDDEWVPPSERTNRDRNNNNGNPRSGDDTEPMNID